MGPLLILFIALFPVVFIAFSITRTVYHRLNRTGQFLTLIVCALVFLCCVAVLIAGVYWLAFYGIKWER